MIEGFVEALRLFQVRGWVIDRADAGSRLSVCLSVDGCDAASGVADVFREDLLAAGVGDGRHGFVVNVDRALPLHRPDSIVVEVRHQDGTRQPLASIAELFVEPPGAHVSVAAAGTGITGYFAANGFDVSGWAFDPAHPSGHLDVEIEHDGHRLGSVRADIFMDDLLRAGIGSGDHGFLFVVPADHAPLPPAKLCAFAVLADGRRQELGIAVDPDSAPGACPAPQGPSFPGAYQDLTQFPVIILGAPRSGTSAMAQALIASGVYAGFEEGHLLDLLLPLLQTTAAFYEARAEEWSADRRTHISSVPQAFVDQGLRHILVEAARCSFPGGRWVDKTPRATMVGAALKLREIWPNARFIYMRRRAMENLDSQLRKFPLMDFEASCREWARSIQGWHAVATALSGAAIEVDQVFMAANPDAVADAVGRLLELDAAAQARVAQALQVDRPERTSAAFGSILDVSSLEWPAHHLASFRSICGPAMALAHYEEGSSYYKDGDARSGLIVL